MITSVNVLFVLMPFLLLIFVYWQYKATVTITGKQDPNAEQKPYTLVQLCADIGKLLISGPVLVAIKFITLSKNQGKHLIAYIGTYVGIIFLILALAACISYYCSKLDRNGTSKNVAILVLMVSNGFSVISLQYLLCCWFLELQIIFVA
ncbi:MAG: hypothetical protein PV340_04655 [Wolbachia sp.]|nr:hypothetical protein [Wolbachia sp.]MDD9336373.1 hypothetical protein [Wolbachia sp.]